MKKILVLIVLLTINIKLHAQEIDDILKLRAFKMTYATGNNPFPDYKDLTECDILVVVSVSKSMLHKITIYSKEEQDYDIVYRNSSENLSKETHRYNYSAVDNKGIKVSIDIGVTRSSDDTIPVLWDFTIFYPNYTIYYISK